MEQKGDEYEELTIFWLKGWMYELMQVKSGD